MKQKSVPEIPDFHSPRNENCEQNSDIYAPCTCVQKPKRKRQCDVINRACIRKHLLEEATTRQRRQYTQVRPQTLDAIAALVKQEIIRMASNAPRTGKTL